MIARGAGGCVVCGAACRGSCVDLVLEVALGEELARVRRDAARFGGWHEDDVFDGDLVDGDGGGCS